MRSVRWRAPRVVGERGLRAGVTLLLGGALVACFDSKRIFFTGDELANGAGGAGADADAPPASVQGGSGPGADAPAPGDSAGLAGGSGLGVGGLDAAGERDGGSDGAAAGGVGVGTPLDAGSEPERLPCSLPATSESGAVLFSGALLDDECRINLDEPYETFWYPYQDSDGASTIRQGATTPGCEPARCVLSAEGPTPGNPPYSEFGAGIGFPLAALDAPLDLRRFRGIEFWIRGTATGTRGPSGASSPDSVFVKLVTTTVRLGDDFGAFCRFEPNRFTLCHAEFANLRRDGYVSDPDPASDELDLENTTRIEFEFRLRRDAEGDAPVPVQFAVELASISFF
jgi:hypothetical protein